MKDGAPGSVDMIIIDSTDPVGPAEGLFGKKFYLDCIKALKPDGMLVQQSESPLLHLKLIQEMHEAMHEAGFVETHLLQFPQLIRSEARRHGIERVRTCRSWWEQSH